MSKLREIMTCSDRAFKSSLKKVKIFLEEPHVQEYINDNDWYNVDLTANSRTYPVGWVELGILWALLRESGALDIQDLDFIPAGFYAYCNDCGNIDFSNKNNLVIKTHFIYKADPGEIVLPKDIKVIESEAFVGPQSHLDIYYLGTKKEWRNIKKGTQLWGTVGVSAGPRIIHCSDGEIKNFTL